MAVNNDDLPMQNDPGTGGMPGGSWILIWDQNMNGGTGGYRYVRDTISGGGGFGLPSHPTVANATSYMPGATGSSGAGAAATGAGSGAAIAAALRAAGSIGGAAIARAGAGGGSGSGSGSNAPGAGSTPLDPQTLEQLRQLLSLVIARQQRVEPLHQAAMAMATRMAPAYARDAMTSHGAPGDVPYQDPRLPNRADATPPSPLGAAAQFLLNRGRG